MHLDTRISLFSLALLAQLWGCAPSPAQIDPDLNGAVQIDLGKQEQDDLIAFYIGGLLSEGTSVGSAAVFDGSAWWLKKPVDIDDESALSVLFRAAGPDARLEWEEFEPVVRSTYYFVRKAPQSLSDLRDQFGDWQKDSWFTHELKGQMSPYKRRLSVPEEDLLWALESMSSPSDSIVYRPGTAIVGEHIVSGEIEETTVMVKRLDGYWDYFAYGSDGRLAPTVFKEPDPLLVPTQCFGCHYGDRAFEPERSFPFSARPGPSGVREVFVPESMKSAAIAKTLSEHARRSDHVLGLYGTLYLASLNHKSRLGEASERELDLLRKLGIELSDP